MIFFESQIFIQIYKSKYMYKLDPLSLTWNPDEKIWILWTLVTLVYNTVKPVLSGHLKTDKTKVLMANGKIMKVESIAECSP